MKSTELNIKVSQVANEVVSDLLAVTDSFEKVNAILLNDFIRMNCTDLGLTFENHTAEETFSTVVKSYIRRINTNLYEMIFPPVGMDKNGNYTTNKALFA